MRKSGIYVRGNPVRAQLGREKSRIGRTAGEFVTIYGD
jgi:hypothetical protein